MEHIYLLQFMASYSPQLTPQIIHDNQVFIDNLSTHYPVLYKALMDKTKNKPSLLDYSVSFMRANSFNFNLLANSLLDNINKDALNNIMKNNINAYHKLLSIKYDKPALYFSILNDVRRNPSKINDILNDFINNNNVYNVDENKDITERPVVDHSMNNIVDMNAPEDVSHKVLAPMATSPTTRSLHPMVPSEMRPLSSTKSPLDDLEDIPHTVSSLSVPTKKTSLEDTKPKFVAGYMYGLFNKWVKPTANGDWELSSTPNTPQISYFDVINGNGINVYVPEPKTNNYKIYFVLSNGKTYHVANVGGSSYNFELTSVGKKLGVTFDGGNVYLPDN